MEFQGALLRRRHLKVLRRAARLREREEALLAAESSLERRQTATPAGDASAARRGADEEPKQKRDKKEGWFGDLIGDLIDSP